MRLWLPSLVALVCASAAHAEWAGQVRLEGAEGSAVTGVAVTNGAQVVRTDDAGRYRLPERDGAFVHITCPDDHACPDWYHPGAGDFLLRKQPADDNFFFIQISDAHVFDDPNDFRRFSSPPFPSWLPNFVTDWITLEMLDRGYPDLDSDDIVAGFREAVAPYRDVADASDRGVYRAYSEAAAAGDLPITHAESRFVEAVSELVALGPSFVLSTGDLWLEANRATPEAIERWRDLYLKTTEESGLPFYNSIGNNEIAGLQNPDFSPRDPRYGKFYFRDTYGPTAYSFDKGPFHFVALDTHRPKPTDDAPRAWSFGEMEPEIRVWADADLAAHDGSVLVSMNHEPFHTDERWGFEDPKIADDGGLFEKHGVAYSLAGHTHRNGFQSGPGTTTHITTGALSGLRWVLPTSIHARGYRLFRAQNRKLYSAWKNLGQPSVGFVTPVDPETIRDLHPASAAPTGPLELTGEVPVVVVAADVAGAFTGMRLELDGRRLDLERWGDYFGSTSIDAAALHPAGSRLHLTAVRADGHQITADLRIRAAP